MSKTQRELTQGDYWHRQYQLLDTTNLINEGESRARIASAGRMGELKQSCIDVPVEGKHDWSSHEMKLDRLYEMLLVECKVGRHDTRVKDCLKAIRDAVVRNGAADTCMARLHKKGGVIGIRIAGLRGKEGAIKHDIQHDVNNIAAGGGGTCDQGEDVLMFRWDVMLTAP